MPRRRHRPPVHRGHRDLSPPGPSGPPAAPAIDLDKAVVDLNRIYIVKSLETVVEVGRYVLDTFFGGDVDAYRRRERDWPAFQALRERNDLAISRTTLVKAVGVLMQLDDLPRELAEQLGVSKHHELLPVQDRETKVELAREAAENKLSATDLRRRVWEVTRHQRRPSTRRPTSPPARAVRAVELKVRALRKELEHGGAWELLDETERAQLKERVERVIDRLEGLFEG